MTASWAVKKISEDSGPFFHSGSGEIDLDNEFCVFTQMPQPILFDSRHIIPHAQENGAGTPNGPVNANPSSPRAQDQFSVRFAGFGRKVSTLGKPGSCGTQASGVIR